LVKLAAVAVDQEPQALLLMCSHTALSAAGPATGGSNSGNPSHAGSSSSSTSSSSTVLQPPLALLQAACGALAAARGVANGRSGYLTVHITHLAWHGFDHGLGPDQWLLLRSAVMGASATGGAPLSPTCLRPGLCMCMSAVLPCLK
jgi:hypothetical protein